MKKSLLTLAALAVSALSHNASAMILPPNDLYKFDNVHHLANMTEQQFNQIADYVTDMWKPFAKMHGADLTVIKAWNDSTVNAYAEQPSPNKWNVHMFGGLARRPEITPDGFALVVCHELGHHFGGYYFYEGNSQWAASEGQADYFATQVCAHQVFAKAPWFNARFRQGVPATVQQACDGVWKEQADRDLCYRSAAGGLSLANLLNALGGARQPVKFETPDPRKVSRTNTAHPEAQCRLDTYFMGALCPVPFDLRVIPARGLPEGQNSAKAEQIAGESSCLMSKGFTKVGYRPLCWFKPQTGGDQFRPGINVPGPMNSRPGFGAPNMGAPNMGPRPGFGMPQPMPMPMPMPMPGFGGGFRR